MNKVILMGRLTRDPEVRYSAGENALAIARYTLAVDRRFRRDGEASADFIQCVSLDVQRSLLRSTFRPGTEDCCYRPYSDWKLYQPRWTEGLHYRGCGRGSGVC